MEKQNSCGQSRTSSGSSNPPCSDDSRLVYIQPSTDSETLLPMTRRAARLSVYLQDIIELMDQQAFQEDSQKRPIIPLRHHPACNANTMKNIIRWCEYHCDDPKMNEIIYEDFENEDEYAKRARKLEELPSYWDRRFLSDIAGDEDPANGEWKNRADLYDLLIAAHFLQIQPIVEIGGKFICQAIREKNVDQVRHFLGIIPDLTEEEIRTMSTDLAFNR